MLLNVNCHILSDLPYFPITSNQLQSLESNGLLLVYTDGVPCMIRHTALSTISTCTIMSARLRFNAAKITRISYQPGTTNYIDFFGTLGSLITAITTRLTRLSTKISTILAGQPDVASTMLTRELGLFGLRTFGSHRCEGRRIDVM